jgi:Ca2+-binding RTX toxin-like protein
MSVSGDAGNDTITANANQKYTLDGGEGNDTISSNSTAALTIEAGNGTNTITANGGGAHTINSGSGKDTISASGGGKNVIKSGAEADTITIGGANDFVNAGSGKDTINFAAGNDQIFGGKDDDSLVYTSSANLTFEDTLAGDLGADTLKLKSGDTAETIEDLDFTNVSSIETLTLNTTLVNAKALSVTLAAKAQAAGIRTFTAKGSTAVTGASTLTVDASAYTAAISLTGSSDSTNFIASSLVGGKGADTLDTGTAGIANTLKGGSGNDTFIISSSAVNDVLQDLSGSDVLIVKSSANGVAATVSADFVATSASANSKSITAVQLTAAAGKKITMTNAGGTFGYTLLADAAGSSMTGSGKADALFGAAGVDSLIGGAGNDTIIGGDGADVVLTGGTGSDTFSYEGIVAAANKNDITDFTVGTGGDVVQLDGALAGLSDGVAVTLVTVATKANTANTLIVDTIANLGAAGVTIGDLSGNNANKHHYAVASDTGAIFFDLDGNWTAGSVQIGSIGTQSSALVAGNFAVG